MGDPTPEPLNSSDFILDDHQKNVIRLSMKNAAEKLLFIPYGIAKTEEEKNASFGKWTDLSKLPDYLDCSGLTNGICRKVGLKFPHGAQNQFDFTVSTTDPKTGDFAFFAHENDINQIYHVGMVYDDILIIESRNFQKNCSFETGKVIFRPRIRWEKFFNYGEKHDGFAGYRSHPKLA